MLGAVTGGVELALRSGAAPLLLGLRWAKRRSRRRQRGVPAVRRGVTVAAKVALDEFLFTTELVSATIVSRRERRRVAQEVDEALALFAKRGWLADPARYHESPPPLEAASFDEIAGPGLAYRHLRFASGYEPHPGEPGRERWLGYAANRTAHAWLIKHPGRMRPWLVCIPGYRMGRPVVDFTGFRVRWLHRTLGLNVAIPVLPLHGPRSVGWRGGDGFLTGDFLDTVHAQAQAIWDVRRLVGWLRSHGAPAVGTYGVSLGGYTTALLAALEEDLDCSIAGIPAADFVRLMRAHVPDLLIRAASRVGFSFENAERLLRVVSPLALPPRVPRERRYLYAGLADHLAPTDHARDLWLHWERPRVVWYHGSHVSFLWEPEVEALVREAVTATGLTPRGLTPPA
ncbi:MAG: hypothetical protein OEM05_01800 [Myxococcales bacterium]|nr:hypothetical protein [Myxococcales bacterium]